MRPKVSIIIPVFNGENYVSKCIDSILNQSYQKFEIIVINDGSTDLSGEVAERYSLRDKRIFCHHQLNKGQSEARNTGIRYASGDYILFIDADDTVDEDYIETLLHTLTSADADLACCGYKEISKNGVMNYSDFSFNSSPSKHQFYEMIFYHTAGVLWSKMFKTEIIQRNNLFFNKNIMMSEDMLFVLEYVSKCNIFACVDRYLYNYNRTNENSISSNISIDYLNSYLHLIRTINEIFIKEKMDPIKINTLLAGLLKNFYIKAIEHQCAHIDKIGITSAIKNVNSMMERCNIDPYRNFFAGNTYWEQPFLFFLRFKLIRFSISYGLFLKILRNLKNGIKKRNKVII